MGVSQCIRGPYASQTFFVEGKPARSLHAQTTLKSPLISFPGSPGPTHRTLMPTDRKSIIDPELATSSPPYIPRSDGSENDSLLQRSTPLLGVPLTGNLLFMMTWITSFGIAKAVYSYHGQSVISPTLDWVGGTILTLMYVFIFDPKVGFREFVKLIVVRSLWLGVIENKRPDLCPWFFEVDLAPLILRFLCHYTGGCCGELIDQNVDCRFCTVNIWLASIPPMLLSVTMVTDGGRLRKYEPAQKDKNIFVEILGGIIVFTTTSLFSLSGSRVFWRGYDRESTSMTAEMMTFKLRVC